MLVILEILRSISRVKTDNEKLLEVDKLIDYAILDIEDRDIW